MACESKLVLGTVNLGMDYGYLGNNTQIEKRTAFDLIDLAIQKSVCFFDTAQDYGGSEKILGEFIRLRKPSAVKVITKFLAANKSGSPVAESLSRLNQKKLYAMLFHGFDDYRQSPELIHRLQSDREAGLVEKIGFSLYLPSQLRLLLDSGVSFQLVQIPYSVFDRRFEPLFLELRERGVEIHARSIFLNGLFFQDPANLGNHFDRIKPSLTEIRRHSETLHVSVATLCLNFVSRNEFVDKLVIGVRSIEELRANLDGLRSDLAMINVRSLLGGLGCVDQDILHPHEWIL